MEEEEEEGQWEDPGVLALFCEPESPESLPRTHSRSSVFSQCASPCRFAVTKIGDPASIVRIVGSRGVSASPGSITCPVAPSSSGTAPARDLRGRTARDLRGRTAHDQENRASCKKRRSKRHAILSELHKPLVVTSHRRHRAAGPYAAQWPSVAAQVRIVNEWPIPTNDFSTA